MNETVLAIIRYIALFTLMIFVLLPLFVQTQIYYPSKQHFRVNMDYEDIYIHTEDNIKINSWYFDPKDKNITVLFCHGNGGNLTFYEELFENLQEKGYGVLGIDYRGYGKSEGNPNEKGLYKDLEAAVKYLKEEKNTPEEQIVLWGLSLGGAVVAQMASENDKFKGVIIQSSFTNIKDMTSRIVHKNYLGIKSDYRNYWSDDFLKLIPTIQKFDTKNKILKIKSPLLIAHSVPDNIVPAYMSEELAELNKNAEVFISEEGGHNDQSWFYPRLFKFLNNLGTPEKNVLPADVKKLNY